MYNYFKYFAILTKPIIICMCTCAVMILIFYLDHILLPNTICTYFDIKHLYTKHLAIYSNLWCTYMNPWPKRVASHLLHFQYQPLHTAHYVCACACICVCVCVKVKNILCSTHVQGMYLMDLRRYVNKPTITACAYHNIWLFW